uniref:Uncharacterized protein n=1 Tax=Zooxanthella nutricula TaxID=1333877 RepID=A0A7S2IS94_9DINO
MAAAAVPRKPRVLNSDATRHLLPRLFRGVPKLVVATVDAFIGENHIGVSEELHHVAEAALTDLWRVFFAAVLVPGGKGYSNVRVSLDIVKLFFPCLSLGCSSGDVQCFIDLLAAHGVTCTWNGRKGLGKRGVFEFQWPLRPRPLRPPKPSSAADVAAASRDLGCPFGDDEGFPLDSETGRWCPGTSSVAVVPRWGPTAAAAAATAPAALSDAAARTPAREGSQLAAVALAVARGLGLLPTHPRNLRADAKADCWTQFFTHCLLPHAATGSKAFCADDDLLRKYFPVLPLGRGEDAECNAVLMSMAQLAGVQVEFSDGGRRSVWTWA